MMKVRTACGVMREREREREREGEREHLNGVSDTKASKLCISDLLRESDTEESR